MYQSQVQSDRGFHAEQTKTTFHPFNSSHNTGSSLTSSGRSLTLQNLLVVAGAVSAVAHRPLCWYGGRSCDNVRFGPVRRSVVRGYRRLTALDGQWRFSDRFSLGTTIQRDALPPVKVNSDPQPLDSAATKTDIRSGLCKANQQFDRSIYPIKYKRWFPRCRRPLNDRDTRKICSLRGQSQESSSTLQSIRDSSVYSDLVIERKVDFPTFVVTLRAVGQKLVALLLPNPPSPLPSPFKRLFD
jgi:hypothetical protein